MQQSSIYSRRCFVGRVCVGQSERIYIFNSLDENRPGSDRSISCRPRRQVHTQPHVLGYPAPPLVTEKMRLGTAQTPPQNKFGGATKSTSQCLAMFATPPSAGVTRYYLPNRSLSAPLCGRTQSN
jgi:hypothetical protein